MRDPFENWNYGDWANLKLFDKDGTIMTPYPDLNEPEQPIAPSPIDNQKEAET